MGSERLRLVARIGRVIPEIKKPVRKVSFSEKVFWTGLVVIVFLIMSEIPLYGVARQGVDPFSALRVIFASSRGTLMELGIGPIVTAGLILQLLKGSRIIQLDFSKPEDKKIYTSLNKMLAIVFTAFQAGAFIFGGVYGRLPLTTVYIVFLQLLSVGILVILMDELIQKGWGLGSGISLFIAAGVTKTVYWESLAPLPAPDGYFVGALLALSQAIMAGSVGDVLLFRAGNLPTLVGFLTMAIIFLVVIYLEGVRVEIPIAHAKFRGFKAKYPVKLFYVSVIPVILASALFANVFFMASLNWNNNPTGFLADFLGKFDGDGNPVSGLVYYFTPPRGIPAMLADPVRTVIYLVAFVLACMGFAWTWVSVAGLGARNVAKQLIDAGMQVPGFRRAEAPIEDILNRYIPVVTILGGAVIGFIAAIADFTGAFGTGTGILLMTTIIWQYYQILAKERIEEMYPGLGRLLGRG